MHGQTILAWSFDQMYHHLMPAEVGSVVYFLFGSERLYLRLCQKYDNSYFIHYVWTVVLARKGSLFLVCSTSQLVSRIVLDTLMACVVFRQIVKQSTGTVYCYVRWEGKHGGTGDPHVQNYTACSNDLAKINMIYHFYARVNWSTVQLTKRPSTIGIRFVTALHSLPMRWLQGQGAHIMTMSWLRVIMTHFCHEVTIITTSCYFTKILL